MPDEAECIHGRCHEPCAACDLNRLVVQIRDKAQAIVDLAYYRLGDSRTTEENTRHDLTQIVGLGRELLAAVGQKPA